MIDPYDPWVYEFCLPAGLTGEAEVNCLHCGRLLTVAVDDPMGS